MKEETTITIPARVFGYFLETIRAGNDPVVPFNLDQNKMLKSAYDLRGDCLRKIEAEIYYYYNPELHQQPNEKGE